MLGDPTAAPYVWGTALHWYQSTDDVGIPVIEKLRERHPTKSIMHTEGCIDAISANGNLSKEDVFLGWANDAWWWNEGAIDWGYDWAPPEQKPDHPPHAPVHRYARDLIEGFNHGFAGWIDWNIVHYVMSHFSRYLRPGDRIVEVAVSAPGLGPDDFHATAALSQDGTQLTVVASNEAAKELRYSIQLGAKHTEIAIPANALQTIRIDLGPAAGGAAGATER